MESRVVEYKFPKQMRLTVGMARTYRQGPLIHVDILCTTRNVDALILCTMCFTLPPPQTTITKKIYT